MALAASETTTSENYSQGNDGAEVNEARLEALISALAGKHLVVAISDVAPVDPPSGAVWLDTSGAE